MSELKTLKGLRIAENLCYRLDTELYLPVKEQLRGVDRPHSLGFKKEDFKRTIGSELERARQEAIKWVKELSEYKEIYRISGYNHLGFCLDCRKWFRREEVIHLDHENLKYIGSRDPQCIIDEFRPVIDTLKIIFSITREDLK